jgi:hypothetical protein
MRKILPALCAVAALAAFAQPAAADDPTASQSTSEAGDGVVANCVTQNKVGEAPGISPWGHYIDGCTVRLACPAHLQGCFAKSSSLISTEGFFGHGVTLNSRTRVFGTPDSAEALAFRDASCDDINLCTAEDETSIKGGQAASVQCNGVRQSADNRAHVECMLRLVYGAAPVTAPAATGTSSAPSVPVTQAVSPPAPSLARARDEVGPAMGMVFRGLGRSAKVRVRCPGDERSCTGRLAVRLNGATLASARFDLDGGTSQPLTVRLSRRQRARLRRAGVLYLKATAFDAAGNRQVRELSFQL